MNKLDFSTWTDPTDFERNELVFEKRNKAYGAYLLRKNYNKTLLRSLTITIFIISGLFLTPKVSRLWAKENIEPVYNDSVTIIIPFNTTPIEQLIKPLKKSKHIQTKGIENPLKHISDNFFNTDTLTMEKLNQAKLGNPEGKDSVADLFVDDGELDSTYKVIPTRDEKIEHVVSIMPEYIGGENALFAYLRDNLEFPHLAQEMDKSGKVNIGFIVEKNGSISSVKILSCSEPQLGFEREAIRVISQMPSWKPGMQDGRNVRVHYSIPINFRLY